MDESQTLNTFMWGVKTFPLVNWIHLTTERYVLVWTCTLTIFSLFLSLFLLLYLTCSLSLLNSPPPLKPLLSELSPPNLVNFSVIKTDRSGPLDTPPSFPTVFSHRHRHRKSPWDQRLSTVHVSAPYSFMGSVVLLEVTPTNEKWINQSRSKPGGRVVWRRGLTFFFNISHPSWNKLNQN